MLIYAPVGRDAQIAGSLLTEAGMRSRSCPDLISFVANLGDDVLFAVVTEEALRSADLRSLSAWVETQPSWSDLPFLILTHKGGGPERNPLASRLSEVLGNVSFLERPFHATTFISVARTALRGRHRQFEARVRIEELDEGERRLQTAIEAGRLGAWELDLASNALATSGQSKKVFGREVDQAFSYDDLLASIHLDDRTRWDEALRLTILTGVDFSIECRTVWPDNATHWAEMRAQLYRDRYGQGIKLVGVSADITSRMLAEERQRHLNEVLEERVLERTAQLEAAHAIVMTEVAQRERAEQQLRQSQKMEAIGQLTGGVAHDFNNLLMAVLSNLQLLRKHVDGDAKAVRLIDGALQGADRGASLTQRLLAFARRQDLQVASVDLRKLIIGIEELLRRSVGSAIVIETKISDHLPLVLADANQIELAVLNLAVNARDAMPDGGLISIDLQHARQQVDEDDLAAGEYVVLSIKDSGYGMDAETLKKAVEPFFSTKELGKGTGLGLSMIHGLALQLKGALKLISSPGNGTTAALWIPVDAAAHIQNLEVADEFPKAVAETGPKRILLVDDDVLIAMSSADMLADLGHEVTEANSGKEALEALNNGSSFDLMITDYSMPGMNGAQLIEAARLLLPELPVLLATGYADLPSGTDIDVPRLGKPYSQEQLATEIAVALSK